MDPGRADYGLWIMDYRLPPRIKGLWIMDYRLPPRIKGLRIMGYRLWIMCVEARVVAVAPPCRAKHSQSCSHVIEGGCIQANAHF